MYIYIVIIIGGACAATGHTASWTLYAISQDADVEAKITEELASLGLLATPERPKPRPLEWEDLSKLVYLNAVIKMLDPSLHFNPACLSKHTSLSTSCCH